jgi:hypothetical protein
MERRAECAILFFMLLVFWACPPVSFGQVPKSSPLKEQLEAQSELAKVDYGTNDGQQQVQGEQRSSSSLTNDDIIKLVQAKLSDSVIIAKIKSSSTDFDTSPDALIKLKRAGVSDAVLQAIVEVPPPPAPTEDAAAENPPGPGCGDYNACITSGNAALGSAQWDDATAIFQAASTLDASKPDAWAGMGNAHLGASRKEEAAAMWDKALSMGGPLTLLVCRPGFGGSCFADRRDRGNLSLGPKLVSFITSSGKTVFAVAPSEVTSAEVSQRRRPLLRNELHLKIGGKNYTFYFVPLGIDCGKEESAYCEEDEAVAQQFVAFNYVSQAIPKLASGALGSSRP